MLKSSFVKFSGLSLGFIGLTMQPLCSDAETPSPKDFKLEEIIVTAQKREQNVNDVPISISAFSADTLSMRQIEQAPDLAFHVPNMQVSGAFGNAQPVYAIRGVTTADYNANQSSAIGMYIDDAYYGSVFTHGLQMFDTERVEVLRGPQGTLYGKNSTAGSINIHSISPTINTDTEGHLAADLGSYNRRRIDIAAQTTLVADHFSARFALYALEHDGYIDNKIGEDLTSADDWAGRLSLLWKINDRIAAELKVTKGQKGGRATAPRSEGRIPTASGGIDFSGYQRSGLDFYESEIDFVGDAELDLDSAVLNVSAQFDGAEFVSVTSWSRADYAIAIDVDGSPFILDHNNVLAASESFTQDLRIQSSQASVLTYIAGIYYSDESLDTSTSYRLFGSPNILQANPASQAFGDLLSEYGTLTALMDIKRKSLAAYGQARWEFGERWGLDMGLRYTQDKDVLQYANVSRYDGRGLPLGSWAPGNITESGLNVDAPFIPPGVISENDPGVYTTGAFTLDSIDDFSNTNNEWTGKLGIDLRWGEATLLFANASRGYRSGNFLGGAYYIDRGKDGLYANPEYVDAYEIGSKYTSANFPLQINTALFYYDYTDMQFVNIVGVVPELENAGGANILGAEFELDYQLTQALKVRWTVGYLDSEYSDLHLADASGNQVDLAGNQLISAPKWNITGGLDYRWKFVNGNSVTATIDGNFQTAQYFSAYNDKVGYGSVSQDNYRVFNGRLMYQTDSWQLSLWGKNIFSEKYDSYALGLAAGLGLDIYNRGAPRTIGVKALFGF